MKIRELSLAGVWEITPRRFDDDRGTFLEWLKDDLLTKMIGHRLTVAQANCSVSAAGVVRGIHFADVPPGQAKYVTCVAGAALDVVVDLRVGSPTFGQWVSVVIDDADRRAVYVPEGFGHAFMALEDGTTLVYLCSEGYAPEREHGIDPFDTDLAISWPTEDRSGRPIAAQTSDKDRDASSFASMHQMDRLPRFETVNAFVASLAVR
jgi:dTDP-4-dehydrorhamnose 3,5-epimerase